MGRLTQSVAGECHSGFVRGGTDRYGGTGVSDAESTTDPRTDPGWTSVARSEELGVKVEVGHINDAWFWVEVAWDDDDLEQAAEASTPEEFEALLRVSAQPIAKSDAEDQSVNQRLEELLHELVNWAGVEEIKHPAVELWKSEGTTGLGGTYIGSATAGTTTTAYLS